MDIQSYVRKKMDPVDAVQVTEENMVEVAKWCNGTIRSTEDPKTGKIQKHIKVFVQRPMSQKQTMAFVGDYVVFALRGFKVFDQGAFKRCFELDTQEVTVVSSNGKPEKTTVGKLKAEFQPATE